MKKNLLFAAAFLITAVMASSASALQFDVDEVKSDVSVSNENNWLGNSSIDADFDPVELAKIKFELFDVGDHETFKFFEITVKGLGAGDADISATLAFELPEVASGTGVGHGKWFTFWGKFSGGKLSWDQPHPILLNNPVGNIKSFKIGFSNVHAIGPGNTATVYATVTAGGALPVPEPATIMLMGIGLMALASVGRRKIKR